jgi:hypothetical protein
MILFSTSDRFLFGGTTIEDGSFFPLSRVTEGIASQAMRSSDALTAARPGNVPQSSSLAREHTAEQFFSYFREVLAANGIFPKKIVSARMCHGTTIARATVDGESIFFDTDGLVTNEPGIALAITGADCAPIFACDEMTGAIGLAHSGRRGTQANIASQLVHEMSVECGSRPSQLSAIIGPGICAEHYEVSEEIAREFVPAFCRDRHLDLPKMIASELHGAGLAPNRVQDVDQCPFELSDRWFSWRRASQAGFAPADIRLQVFFAMIRP